MLIKDTNIKFKETTKVHDIDRLQPFNELFCTSTKTTDYSLVYLFLRW